MDWLKSHLPTVIFGAGVALAFCARKIVRVLTAVYRSLSQIHETDRALADGFERQRDLERSETQRLTAELSNVKRVLRDRLIQDDARDEIHAQDIAEKKQLCLKIEALKTRLREHRIDFDDLL